MPLDRRFFVLGSSSLAFVPQAAWARALQDSAGRAVTVPDKVERIFCAGPPASVVVAMLKPEAMLGWPRALREEEKPYLAAATRELPEVGTLTGRGDTANVEKVLQLKPDLIVDFGSVRPTFASLADNVQARTGIPYVLIDGRFEATPSSLRSLGAMLGVADRGNALADYVEALFKRLDTALAAIPGEKRPRVYLARGPKGLETALAGSINGEIIDRAGGRNVFSSEGGRQGLAGVSIEQVLAADPDTIITWDRNFHRAVFDDPLWRDVEAVKRKRVYLSPTAPFGWIDRPPSVNRIMGLAWLAHLFHGDAFPLDLKAETRRFYRLFYQVELGDADLDRLLAWADGQAPNLSAPGPGRKM